MSEHTVNGAPAPVNLSSVEVRPIPGHDGYLASSDGRVYSMRGKLMRELAQIPGGPKRAYRYANLARGVRRGIHQLVAETFIPRPEGVVKLVVRHRDNNPQNNAAGNLLWGTQAQNLADRVSAGTMTWGERNGQAKLGAAAVADIRHRRANGERCRDIAADHGISFQAVHKIGRGLRWAQVDVPIAPRQRSKRKDAKCSA